ncbi:MAG: hypothetical protein Q7R54_03660 [bacterium]|nr:hypothetical protein [bacterium]
MLKNSYVLGLLLVAIEGGINYLFGFTLLSPLVLALGAGAIYTMYHKEKMPSRERFKTISVYLMALAIILYLVARTIELKLTIPYVILMAGIVFIVYGLLIYLFLGFGSSVYLKTLKQGNRVTVS